MQTGRHILPIILAILVASCLLASCADKTAPARNPGLTDGRYDGEYPASGDSSGMETVIRSVKKLYSVSHYTTWQFSKEARVTPYHLFSGAFRKLALGTISTQETVFGTATILPSAPGTVALLTCAHVVTARDTLISFFDPDSETSIGYIRSISLKEKQENWVKDLSPCGPFPVLASDAATDIAILSKPCEAPGTAAPAFPFPMGHAGELRWGSVVYIFGYPLGNPAVTRAIVSKPDPADAPEFSVDALLNKGFSGGVILAVRDGMPHFELVGMVKSVSSKEEYYLRPASDDKKYYEVFPYTGEIHIGTSETVSYGLNYVIPAETIRAFCSMHKDELARAGISTELFFPPKK
jgi:hypothetical protein